jgi:HD superfamily phosphohydrolase YqeK
LFQNLNSDELNQVRSVLSENEMDLWVKYQSVDQRHSIVVLNRLNVFMPHAGRDAQVAALMHDIGKSVSRLGVISRVAATVFGPKTQRFSQYLSHERIGIDLLEAAGCSDITIALLKGVGDPKVIAALSDADNI